MIFIYVQKVQVRNVATIKWRSTHTFELARTVGIRLLTVRRVSSTSSVYNCLFVYYGKSQTAKFLSWNFSPPRYSVVQRSSKIV